MELRKLLQHPQAHGCRLHHHGSRHDMWINPRTEAQVAVPRHRKLKLGTALKVCRQMQVPPPRER